MRSYKTVVLTLLATFIVTTAQAWTILDWFTSKKTNCVQSIKVLLLDEVNDAFLEIGGAHNIFDPRNGNKLGSRFVGKGQRIQCIPGGLKWGEEFPGVYQIKIAPDDATTSLIVNGIQFNGSVYIYNIDNHLSVVNEVDIEDYVMAVLAAQVDQGLPRETLSALAITERTDAFYRALHSRTPFFHVEATEVNYQGQGVVMRRGDVVDAVNHTRQLVMVNNDGAGPSNTFAAQWTEHSAGRTAPYHVVFRKDGNAGVSGVDSPFAAVDRAATSWSSSITRHDLARATRMDHVAGVKVSRDAISGKVFNVRLEDGPMSKDFDYVTFSHVLGSDVIKSSEFEVRVNGDIVTFTGYGRGHGVGLCLYGATRLEEKGADARQILNSFFPEAHIEVGKRHDRETADAGGLYQHQYLQRGSGAVR